MPSLNSRMSLVAAVLCTLSQTLIAEAPALKYGDGEADGKKSLGGSGEIIGFALPQERESLEGLRIHGSRYGSANAPHESFLIYVMSQDLSQVLHTELAAYSLFERGPEKWVEVKFRKPIDVPQEFWVALDFRAGRTKGVYVSYDTSTEGKHSRVGLPGLEIQQTDFHGDWMIEVLPAK